MLHTTNNTGIPKQTGRDSKKIKVKKQILYINMQVVKNGMIHLHEGIISFSCNVDN